MNHQVDILLATYNGGVYLQELLDSLLNQSYRDWKIIARDDGSSDSTVEILRRFSEQNPGKLTIIEDKDNNLRACGNFARLLENTEAPYIMFCDQDDVWMPDKIRLTLDKMLQVEGDNPDTPILIHTDLTVTDSDLKPIADSMWKYQKLPPDISYRINWLSIQNVVTGCTMMINQNARKLSLPIHVEAVMHDWWIAMKVAMSGIVDYIDTPTIYYRQHGHNELGAKKTNIKYYLKKVSKIGKASRDFRKVRKMNKALGLPGGYFRLLWRKIRVMLMRLSYNP